MRRWQQTWVVARGYPAGSAVDGGVRMPIGLPERMLELLAYTDDPAVHDAMAREVVGVPGALLTVPTRDRKATERALAAHGLVTDPPEWIMTRDLDGHPTAAVPQGYSISVEAADDDRVLLAKVRAGGVVAAEGQLAVLGTDAAADRIMTDEAHRRRGLGQAVMGALVTEAGQRGAVTGLLVASAAGRHLYESLGWHVVAGIVCARPAPS